MTGGQSNVIFLDNTPVFDCGWKDWKANLNNFLSTMENRATQLADIFYRRFQEEEDFSRKNFHYCLHLRASRLMPNLKPETVSIIQALEKFFNRTQHVNTKPSADNGRHMRSRALKVSGESA